MNLSPTLSREASSGTPLFKQSHHPVAGSCGGGSWYVQHTGHIPLFLMFP
jgi:hypothetical protein